MIKKIQNLLHRIPWYVFGIVFSLSLLSIYSNSDDSLVVIFNMGICACMVWAAFHNLEHFSESLQEDDEETHTYL